MNKTRNESTWKYKITFYEKDLCFIAQPSSKPQTSTLKKNQSTNFVKIQLSTSFGKFEFRLVSLQSIKCRQNISFQHIYKFLTIFQTTSDPSLA